MFFHHGIAKYLFLLLCIVTFCQPALCRTTIVSPDAVSEAEQLAAKEVQRYIYVRTDQLLQIDEANSLPDSGDAILVATDANAMVESLRDAIGGHAPDGGFIIKSIETNGRTVLVIAGDDPTATLYGAYRFAEHLGVRFGLALDVIPDEKIDLSISGFDEAGKPLFDIRGLFPFHDFPEGPDFWSTEDYMGFISQFPKLGMNFIGLHTYPTWSTVEEKEIGDPPQGPEPNVWIGLPEDVNDDGTVDWAYPAYYAHTHRPHYIWGYGVRDTGKFFAGSSRLFDRDGYGSNVFKNGKMPDDLESSIGVFNRTGKMLNTAFTHSKKLGVKTAVGTELPLGLEPEGPEVEHNWIRGIPPKLQQRLKSMGKNPANPDVVREVYKGIFERITKTHPLDYYWLWSWEVWSNYGVSDKQIKAFESDMRIAHEVLKEMNEPFQLAHAGWIIGTDENPAEFDDVLPPEAPFYGLWDQAQGFEELSAERVKWAATWLEEDWGLVQPQFELTRIYNDVKAALDKDCHGMIAKYWRTRVLSMNAGALKDLLWNYGPVGSTISNEVPLDRDQWMEDYYRDWARHRFGPEAASSIAAIFLRLDKAGEERDDAYPVALGWDAYPSGSAPAAIMPNESDWSSEKSRYAFVDEFAALRSEIKGAGNLERFDYWLNTLKAWRHIGHYGTLRHEFRTAIEEREDIEAALAKRKEMARLWEDLMTVEIQRVTNESDLGEIVNLEILTWYQLMMLQWDGPFKERLGKAIPAEANPSKEYSGPPLLRAMPQRTHLYRREPLELTIIAMGDPESVRFHWRPLGTGEYKSVPCQHVARSVYSVSLPAQSKNFEYYIETQTLEGAIRYPSSAPGINQTVVVSGDTGLGKGTSE